MNYEKLQNKYAVIDIECVPPQDRKAVDDALEILRNYCVVNLCANVEMIGIAGLHFPPTQGHPEVSADLPQTCPPGNFSVSAHPEATLHAPTLNPQEQLEAEASRNTAEQAQRDVELEAHCLQKEIESMRETIYKVMKDRDDAHGIAEKLRDEGRKSVILLRCTECLTIPQQNSNEFSGGECGGCIAKERDECLRGAGHPIDALRQDVSNRIQREIRMEDEATTYRKLLSGDAKIIGELQGWLNDIRDALGKDFYIHDQDLAAHVASLKEAK
jgi:hypothetical protein